MVLSALDFTSKGRWFMTYTVHVVSADMLCHTLNFISKNQRGMSY